MRHFRVGNVVARQALLLATLFIGCTSDAAGPASEEPDVELLDQALAKRGKEFTDNKVVISWNQIAFDAAFTHDGFSGFENVRAMTMMHLAIHDALNAIVPTYQSYAFSLARGQRDRAHPTAAVVQAAYDIMVNAYPTQQSTFDASRTTWLADVPDGARKESGIKLGRDAAAAIIKARTGDRMDVVGEYTPGTEPGDYQFVPPFDFVYQPAFGESVPFGLKSGAQFRPEPPPDLRSPDYAEAYNEVKSVGALNSTERTQDQSYIAQFWYEGAEASWNRVANTVARGRKLSLFRTARMFALLNMAFTDGYVAGWNAKQFYDFWRPYTAIRAGETDDNPATEPDAQWESFLVAPPLQDYPSTHSVLSAAAADVLEATFGTDHVRFTMQSSSADPANLIRTYDSLQAAANENADSRVRAGIHFRFATDAGLAQGHEIGPHLVAHYLRPR